jgi:hypothetical protein
MKMTDTQIPFPGPNFVSENLSKGQTIVHKEPPSYGFLYPLSLQNEARSRGIPTMSIDPSWRSNFQMNEIRSYEIWSILNTLFCCLILGLVAYHYSNETKELQLRNDIQGAMNASRNARTLNIIATIVGTIFISAFIYINLRSPSIY